jgi:hypothetical protein
MKMPLHYPPTCQLLLAQGEQALEFTLPLLGLIYHTLMPLK